LDTEMHEQLARTARIFRGNQIHLRQQAPGAGGNIPEIADGCCHHV
jgi:hypothetical protein